MFKSANLFIEMGYHSIFGRRWLKSLEQDKSRGQKDMPFSRSVERTRGAFNPGCWQSRIVIDHFSMI